MEIEIIHADGVFNDINTIRRIKSFDAVASISEKSDFVMQIPSEEWLDNPIEIGHIIYQQSSEWGGFVNRVKTMGDTVEIGGLLWRGLLRKSIISPPEGHAYKVVSGKANLGITQLISDHFDNLFVIETGDDFNVSGQFRFQDVGTGIERLLSDGGGRLEIIKRDKSVGICSRISTDWSQKYEFSEDYGVLISIENDQSEDINHVIALGSGELLNRMVIEAWLLSDGRVTYDKSAMGRPTGLNERTYKLDYPNAESEDELKAKIVEILQENRKIYKTEMDLSGLQLIDLNLGDIVASRDRLTGIFSKQKIAKKIYKIADNGICSIRYEVSGG